MPAFFFFSLHTETETGIKIFPKLRLDVLNIASKTLALLTVEL